MLKGVDTSHWEATFNFARAKADGCVFMMTKATEGSLNVDPDCKQLIAAAKAQGLLTGMYHFFHAGQSVPGQVANYINRYHAIGTDMRPILDFETASADGLRSAEVVASAWAWIQAVEIQLNRPVMIYGGESFLGSLGLGPQWAKHALWLADYSRPEIPAPWTDYTFWQYTDAGEQKADTNWFNGTQAQLQAFCAV